MLPKEKHYIFEKLDIIIRFFKAKECIKLKRKITTSVNVRPHLFRKYYSFSNMILEVRQKN